MGVFDGLKRTLNIAGAKITITVDGKMFSQNDSVEGVVDIIFPDYRLSGDSITIELTEYIRMSGANGSGYTAYRTYEKKILHKAFDFDPGRRLKFPFEFSLPINSRITTDEDGWALKVRLDVPNAVDPKEKLKLNVVHAKELLYLVEACEEILEFKEDKYWRKWDSTTKNVYFHLNPPKKFKSQIDALSLDIRKTEDGDVSGHLIFNLPEKSVGDCFKALRGEDFVKKEVTIDSSIFDVEKGQPDKGAISEIINWKLREVIQSLGLSQDQVDRYDYT